MIFCLFGIGLAAIITQMIEPKLPLSGMKPYLIALPVLYGAMRMEGGSPFVLAILLGALVDILSPAMERLGTEAFVLCLLVLITWTQRGVFPFANYLSAAVLALVTTFVALVVDYFLFCWESGTQGWHFGVWVQFAWMAIINLFLAVPFFWFCDLVFIRWWKLGVRPPEEGERSKYAL
jgi:rod shape-determining protein MreD